MVNAINLTFSSNVFADFRILSKSTYFVSEFESFTQDLIILSCLVEVRIPRQYISPSMVTVVESGQYSVVRK